MDNLIKTIKENTSDFVWYGLDGPVRITFMGGEHSGHHGHAGRPGSVGGSAPKGSGFIVYQPTRGPYKERYVQLGDHKVSVVMDQKKGKFKVSDVEKAISECPREHIDTLTPTNPEGLKISVRDELYEKRGGQYVRKSDNISIATKGRTKEAIRHTIHHEVGHRVQGLKGLRDDPRWSKIVDERFKLGVPMDMWYAKEHYSRDTNLGYREAFASSYASFLSNKEAFAKFAPEMYNYMKKEVFGE